MTKTRLVATALLSLIATAAFAQSEVPSKDLPENGGAGVRSGHITSTGATVPNPGEPQGAGTTSLDRGIQQEDNKIDGSICKGC